MGEIGGFLKVRRVGFDKRAPERRVRDYRQYFHVRDEHELSRQGGRCMDCGVPFCHEGCPLGNLIPDWNDLVYRGDWRGAIEQLHSTNNFPEFTGLICPAPCESACVLDINDDPVTIEQIELGIAERAWQEGWIVPQPPQERTGMTVGVVGSGPAGMALAAELNKLGHLVTVYERDESPGGLMRYGVPDAKLEKWIIDRRVSVLEREGIRFECNIDVGRDLSAAQLRERHDAVALAIGSRVHRDLDVPGRELEGVHYAMDYLYQRNRFVARLAGRPSREAAQPIVAEDKRVVVVGGGDTGMDCISNALREGATDVKMLDVYPELPPSGRADNTPWPLAPKRTLTTYALDEGGQREWNAEVVALEGAQGRLTTVHARRVQGTSSRDVEPVPGSEHTLEADLLLIAIGFSGPQRDGAIAELGLELDPRGNVRSPLYESSAEGVFACGDARLGQSLVVTAIAEGRKCARLIDRHLCERNGRAPVPQDPDAHFIEIAAKTAGTITTAHRIVKLPEDAGDG